MARNDYFAKRRPRRTMRPRSVLIGAGLLVLVAGGWFFWPRGGDVPPPAAEPAPQLAADVTSTGSRDRGAGAAAGADGVDWSGGMLGPRSAAAATESDEVLAPPTTALQPVSPPPSLTETSEPPPAAETPRVTDNPAAADAPTATTPPTAAQPPAAPVTEGNAALAEGRRLVEAGRLLEARAKLNPLLGQSLPPAEQEQVRRLLAQVAERTVFARQPVADDPLVELYTVQSGDNLVNIGRTFKVPHEAIMQINGITNPNRLRVGQKLNIPRGPFHARISKSAFRMDIYLGDTYVRSYPVGLGADQGTPEGEWLVKNRLPNPTYYPPASAAEKRIIPPGDPTNPLGGHWIGLEGINGQTVGREGYGIHGTIEPESIGRAVSLGCVRMHNEDVAVVYGLLRPGESRVTIVP